MLDSSVVGYFAYGGATATGGTAFVQGIAPFQGIQGAGPLLYQTVPGVGGLGRANWWGAGNSSKITRINSVVYNTGGSTAQVLYFMSPFNFAYVTTDVAANTATFILDKDPGVYSTNFRYNLANKHAPSSVANNAIAAADYVAYQLNDGTWVFDTVASGTFAALVLTTSTPNISGGGVSAGTAMFFFGIITDKNPNNGVVCPKFTVPASTVNVSYGNGLTGNWSALNPGDPMIVYSDNATNAGILQNVSGFYANLP